MGIKFFGTDVWYVLSCLNAFCVGHYPEYRNGIITKMQQNDAVNINLESLFLLLSAMRVNTAIPRAFYYVTAGLDSLLIIS